MKTLTKAGIMLTGLAASVAADTTISVPYINLSGISQTLSELLGVMSTLVGTDLPPFIAAIFGILVTLVMYGVVMALITFPIVILAWLLSMLKGMKVMQHFKL